MTAQTFKLEARTIASAARVSGVGLHSGAPASVVLAPAQPGAGVAFVRAGGERVPASWALADAPGGQTRLPGVQTPEHLLAAVQGLGITDLDVRLDGPEVPHLDGSAQGWADALGTPVVTGSTVGFVPDRPVEVEAFGGTARWEPHDRLELTVRIDFGPSLRGGLTIDVTPESFVRELCWARTFLPHDDLAAARAAGRGAGATPGTVVVWGRRGPLVPVRSPDEPVRHKALDLLGDLALAGPVRGRIVVERGTHALHQALLAAALSGAR